MSAVEVDVTRVLVQPGQRLDVGDPIAEVESEKVTYTVEAEAPGVVAEVLVAEGDQREVGDLLCRIEEAV